MTDSRLLRTLVALPLSFSLLLLSKSGQNTLGGSTRAAAEDKIREAVIRYQMEEWRHNAEENKASAKGPWEKKTANKLNYKVYFISVGGKDPSDEFVNRFRNVPRLVKKVSKARTRISRDQGVLDRETNLAGIIFRVGEIRWVSSGSAEAEVAGGFYCGGRCGSTRTFLVHLEGKRWAVQLLRIDAVL